MRTATTPKIREKTVIWGIGSLLGESRPQPENEELTGALRPGRSESTCPGYRLCVEAFTLMNVNA